jgi:hypothetical protein
MFSIGDKNSYEGYPHGIHPGSLKKQQSTQVKFKKPYAEKEKCLP